MDEHEKGLTEKEHHPEELLGQTTIDIIAILKTLPSDESRSRILRAVMAFYRIENI